MANPIIHLQGKSTQFKPGQSGNPKGRPKGSRNTQSIVRDMLDGGKVNWSKIPIKNRQKLEKIYGRDIAKAIICVAFAKALEGDVRAMRWLSETAYGKLVNVTIDDLRQLRIHPTPIYTPPNPEDDRSSQLSR